MLIAVAIVATLAMNPGGGSADRALRERALQFVGANAKDCGALSPTPAPGAVSEPCLVYAFRKHEAAFWVSHTGSVASPADLAYALMSAGHLLVLSRERISGPIEEYECADPAIVLEFGKERLRCKERYVPPFGAASAPFRTGGGVAAPRPVNPLFVNPAICKVEPGKALQVEFVVGEDGTVRMVDVLVAPIGCDIPAVASSLAKTKFVPGSLNSAPVMTSWFTIITRSSESAPPN